MKEFYKRLMDVEKEALNFILNNTTERTFTIKPNGNDNTTDMSIGVYSHGNQVDIDIHEISNTGIKGWDYDNQRWVVVDWEFSSHERGNFSWIADFIEKTLIEEEEDALVPKEVEGVKLTDEQRQLYKELDAIDTTPFLYTLDGKIICELNTYTDGGVNEVISCDFDIDSIVRYIDEFDIDAAIDLYRQSEDYRSHFTIKESVEDFEEWVEEQKGIFDEIKERIS